MTFSSITLLSQKHTSEPEKLDFDLDLDLDTYSNSLSSHVGRAFRPDVRAEARTHME